MGLAQKENFILQKLKLETCSPGTGIMLGSMLPEDWVTYIMLREGAWADR